MSALAVQVVSAVRFTVVPWLAQIAGVTGGVHWIAARETVQPPLITVQLVGPGKVIPFVAGGAYWEGEVLIRVIAPTLADAEAIAAGIPAAIPAGSVTPTGYPALRLAAALGRPLDSTVGQVNAQAGCYLSLTIG